MSKMKVLISALIISLSLQAQTDTIKYQWPVVPLNSSQFLTAGFSEFRNTLSSDHFHNAVDIAEPDGNPVYSCISGAVYSKVNDGSNSYVSVITNYGGIWKRITYLHILPSPSISVGQSVTRGVTILGTIYSGQGHVHLIERELVNNPDAYAVEINNIRPNGGLDPFNDPYSPEIDANTIQFVLNGTMNELPADNLAAKLDIIIRVRERNGTSASHINNGTYILGYRLWDAAGTSIINEPHGNGVKYKFDTKPNNSDVHNVFVDGVATLSNPLYIITNGSGAANINITGAVSDNYLDTELYDEGDYQLEIFTEDTRGNTANAFFPISITHADIVAPERPVLKSILNTDSKKGVHVSWTSNSESDLLGYRLYYTGNTQLLNFELAADENTLTKELNSFDFNSPAEFINPTSDEVYFFYLTAVDSIGNESKISDTYSRSSYFDGTTFPKALIVDGFDRYGGSASWAEPTHTFNTDYFAALTVSDSIVLSSCANEAVTDNSIDLNNFDMVFWYVGDESTVLETFSVAEQQKLQNYLENGGKLFVTGSEIGWDLGRSHTASASNDLNFYQNYLKASFIDDGSSSMNLVTGISGSIFEGVSASIGQIYPEDYPDDIDPVNGSSAILNFNQFRSGAVFRKAGVAYTGTFGNSADIGKVIYFSFPWETTASFTQRRNLISKVLDYFDLATNIADEINPVSAFDYKLEQNYPNPFNPATTINYSILEKNIVRLAVYDVLGREVDVLINEEKNAGNHKVVWNADKFASGVYFARITAGDYKETIRMILLK